MYISSCPKCGSLMKARPLTGVSCNAICLNRKCENSEEGIEITFKEATRVEA